jgi:hypothetical protein
MSFSVFCGRKESDGLFNWHFLNQWIHDQDYGTMDDDFSMHCMGGEL